MYTEKNKQRSINASYLGSWRYVLLCLVLSCQHEPSQIETFVPSSSWEVIQHHIFEPNCVACHSSNSRFARQSNLILDKEQGYEQLMNQQPSNLAAREDGLLLLGNEGLKSLEESYLWEKINAREAEHFYADHPDYGELMPLGGLPLTNGELDYIKWWMIRGAPKEGFVVSDSLLEDQTRIELGQATAMALTPPDTGFQLHVGPFEIAAHQEREIYYFIPQDNQTELFVQRFEVSMRPGSHHFLLNRYEADNFPKAHTYRDLYNERNTYKWSTLLSIQGRLYLYGSQYRYAQYSFPEGVALRLPAECGPEINVHYVNTQDYPIQGEVWVNVHTIPASAVSYQAETLYLDNRDIHLPAHKETTLSSTYLFDERRQLLMLFSHAHKHNIEFRIYMAGGDRDGELIYFSRDWEHPPQLQFDPPITIEAGNGLRGVAVYDNDTDKTIKYGVSAETDEMMMMLGTYYLD